MILGRCKGFIYHFLKVAHRLHKFKKGYTGLHMACQRDCTKGCTRLHKGGTGSTKVAERLHDLTQRLHTCFTQIAQVARGTQRLHGVARVARAMYQDSTQLLTPWEVVWVDMMMSQLIGGGYQRQVHCIQL